MTFTRRGIFRIVGAALAGRAADPDLEVLKRFLRGDLDVADFIMYCRGGTVVTNVGSGHRLFGIHEAVTFTPRPYMGIWRTVVSETPVQPGEVVFWLNDSRFPFKVTTEPKA